MRMRSQNVLFQIRCKSYNPKFPNIQWVCLISKSNLKFIKDCWTNLKMIRNANRLDNNCLKDQILPYEEAFIDLWLDLDRVWMERLQIKCLKYDPLHWLISKIQGKHQNLELILLKLSKREELVNQLMKKFKNFNDSKLKWKEPWSSIKDSTGVFQDKLEETQHKRLISKRFNQLLINKRTEINLNEKKWKLRKVVFQGKRFQSKFMEWRSIYQTKKIKMVHKWFPNRCNQRNNHKKNQKLQSILLLIKAWSIVQLEKKRNLMFKKSRNTLIRSLNICCEQRNFSFQNKGICQFKQMWMKRCELYLLIG